MAQLANIRQKLIGTWKLVSWRSENTSHTSKAAEILYPVGKDAQGLIMYTPDGYMSAHLMKPGAKNWAIDDVLGGTPEERADMGAHYLAYTGRFRIEAGDDGSGVVYHEVRAASIPNWIGGVQKRHFTLEGDTLTLSTDPIITQGKVGQSTVEWRRAEPN